MNITLNAYYCAYYAYSRAYSAYSRAYSASSRAAFSRSYISAYRYTYLNFIIYPYIVFNKSVNLSLNK